MASGADLLFKVVCGFQVHTPGSEVRPGLSSQGKKTGSGMRPLKFGVRLWARKETPRWVRWHTLVIPGPGNPRLKTVSSRPAWATRWGSAVTKEKEEICSPGVLCLLSKITGGQRHQTELVTGAMASGYLQSTGPSGSPPAPHLNTCGSIPCLSCTEGSLQVH